MMSAATVEDLPPSRGEVAIIGRSNVGKSTLLNALANEKGLAKVSATPGRTRLLNCFRVGTAEGHDRRTLIDLPGYGYAKASAKERAIWDKRMRLYLRERQPLKQALLLVDGEIGPAKLDVDMLRWMRDQEVPFRIVATKHDKVKSSKRDKRKRDLTAGCGVEDGEIVWTSAEKNVGIDRLRTIVRDAIG